MPGDGPATVEEIESKPVRSVDGEITAMRALSRDVVEVGIATDRALPHHPGQYAQVQFDGFPSRPFSLTHPVDAAPGDASAWFHIRRMPQGSVTRSLGAVIKPGHRVTISGPFGGAYFRPNHSGRLVLVATNTGFAPIWAIAAAALRENPHRMMMVIAGGRTLDALYMAPALAKLATFRNVRIAPMCSTPQTVTNAIHLGRPTDALPQLLPTDAVYVCGARGVVESIKAIAAQSGAVCFADPFLQSNSNTNNNVAASAESQPVLARTLDWLSVPKSRRVRGVAVNRDRIDRQPSLRLGVPQT
jgi:NAD(P)H-flavin reductase